MGSCSFLRVTTLCGFSFFSVVMRFPPMKFMKQARIKDLGVQAWNWSPAVTRNSQYFCSPSPFSANQTKSLPLPFCATLLLWFWRLIWVHLITLNRVWVSVLRARNFPDAWNFCRHWLELMSMLWWRKCHLWSQWKIRSPKAGLSFHKGTLKADFSEKMPHRDRTGTALLPRWMYTDQWCWDALLVDSLAGIIPCRILMEFSLLSFSFPHYAA